MPSRSEEAANAVFVDLASISDTGLVATTIIRALGIRDHGDHAPADLLKRTLTGKRMLLVLDNFEHVIAARSLVGELLAACPQLRLLVTSRTPLRLQGEQLFPVPPLALPDAGRQVPSAEIEQSPAVMLFVQRAKAADPHFAFSEANAQNIAEACQRLDGLPLAIELAAARVKLLPPDVLVSLIKRRLPLLASGPQDAPERQRAMRATLDWSYDLLSPEAQTLFCRLAVFAGGCTLEALEAICAEGLPDVMGSLTELSDQSLIHRENGSSMFRMQEVVREYAIERLDDHGDAIHRAHAAYYLALTGRTSEEMSGPGQGAWLTRLTAEEGNLAVALEFAICQQDADTALHLGGNLWMYWQRRGLVGEGRLWLERALAIAGETPTPIRGYALRNLANLAVDLTDFTRAQTLFEANQALCQELGIELGVAISRQGLGVVALYRGDYDRAREYFDANLEIWRANGDTQFEAVGLHSLGDLANALGQTEEARSLLQQALAIQQAAGDVGGIAYSILSLAEAAVHDGDAQAAQPLFERSLALFEDIGDQPGVAHALFGIGRVSHLLQDYAQAVERFAEALALWQEFGDRRGIVECIEGIAGAALALEDLSPATRLYAAADVTRSVLGAAMPLVDRPAFEANLSELRLAQEGAAFASDWALGQIMTIDQAATEAAALAATWKAYWP